LNTNKANCHRFADDQGRPNKFRTNYVFPPGDDGPAIKWQDCLAAFVGYSFFTPKTDNPILKLWDQAKVIYRNRLEENQLEENQLEEKIQCLVSIGTGFPSAEEAAESFRLDKPRLEGHYHRFNVFSGLEGVGLDEAKKINEVAAATRRYISARHVLRQMRQMGKFALLAPHRSADAPRESLRLLALDGGGIRGLSSLMILDRLMETINPESPPKPCKYFHMIGGTSTGG
jgi:hypothetical protein